MTYDWGTGSTYVRYPPFFEGMGAEPEPIADVKRRAAAGDVGRLRDHRPHLPGRRDPAESGPAGEYLTEYQVRPAEFNSYGARRGNHEIMMRGTFANIRIRNEMVPDTEGGVARHLPSGEVMPIYEAAMRYQDEGVPLVVVGGKEYGTGSSRDWAAKGTRLLGIQGGDRRKLRAHPPLEPDRHGRVAAGVQGRRQPHHARPHRRGDLRHPRCRRGIWRRARTLTCRIHRPDGTTEEIPLLCRIDTTDEVEYYRHGGILHYVLAGPVEGRLTKPYGASPERDSRVRDGTR